MQKLKVKIAEYAFELKFAEKLVGWFEKLFFFAFLIKFFLIKSAC